MAIITTLVNADNSEQDEELLDIIERQLSEFSEFSDISSVRLAVHWTEGVEPDVDGLIVNGSVKLSPPDHRRLHNKDVLMFINKDFWNDASSNSKEALIHHELSHIQVSYDSEGSVKLNKDGSIKYRLRNHDIEEFHETRRRFGSWNDGLGVFITGKYE